MAMVKPLLEWVLQRESLLARRWVSSAHRRLMTVQWRLPPQPEHFDHDIDLFHGWRATRNSLWTERGVLGGLTLKGGTVLDLACGDGFNARNFYSLRSKHVVACDFNPAAIATAKRKNGAPNVEFVLADIRVAMPAGQFENVVWDAAIQLFTPTEIESLLHAITLRLAAGGILSGCTIVERADGVKSLSHHEHEFRSKEELSRFLAPHFRNVTVFETVYPERRNLYFWASNGSLPFHDDWPHALSASRTT